MQVTVHDDPGSVRRMAGEWQELAGRARAAPCAHPAWCLPWWEHLVAVTARGGREGRRAAGHACSRSARSTYAAAVG